MSIQIKHKSDQAKGAFAGGAIIENKPIGFPQDGGNQKPYSNLFYWANAWSDNGGLIGEHPHKMFEIMSFVVDGEIQHYDNKFDRWLSLKKGDAQIIRAGSGITHAEKIVAGGRMFQIWFDPDIQQTVQQEASYNDYKSEEIKTFEKDGITVKNYTGNGGPVIMDSEGVVINEFKIPTGEHRLKLNKNKIHSYYLISGEANINDNRITENDFIKIEDEDELTVLAKSIVVLFHIEVPKKLSYKTYLELVKY